MFAPLVIRSRISSGVYQPHFYSNARIQSAKSCCSIPKPDRIYDRDYLFVGSIEYNNKLCLNILIPMPKLKSRKAAAKRFRASGTGKIMRRKAFKSHLLEHKNADRRRSLSKATCVDETDVLRVRGMLPYL